MRNESVENTQAIEALKALITGLESGELICDGYGEKEEKVTIGAFQGRRVELLTGGRSIGFHVHDGSILQDLNVVTSLLEAKCLAEPGVREAIVVKAGKSGPTAKVTA